ncbi:histone H1 [Tanacetum coccineum]
MSPTVIHSKAKKSLALRKHPPYLEFIEDKYNDMLVNFKKILLIQLKKLVDSDKLVKVKASFKLPSTAKPKPKAPAKGKPTAKPKTAPASNVIFLRKYGMIKRQYMGQFKVYGICWCMGGIEMVGSQRYRVMPIMDANCWPFCEVAATEGYNSCLHKGNALNPRPKAGSAKAAAKPNPTPKAMPAANNSYKPARQRKRSARLITMEEISRHYGKSFEEAADILSDFE